jgi:molybdate transport system ATP-binding protein
MSLDVDIRRHVGEFELDVRFSAEGGGAMTALFGPSGAGKTMTLKSISGLVRPDEGSIVLDGQPLFDSTRGIDLPTRTRRVGYLFQSYALFPTMTVEQNIACGVRAKDRAERLERTAQQIRAMRLEGLEKRRPHQLSGGEQQRVALARCLANDPAVLLLDEPFSAIDEDLRGALEDELLDSLASFSGPCILVSHDRAQVERLCSAIVEIRGGHAG